MYTIGDGDGTLGLVTPLTVEGEGHTTTTHLSTAQTLSDQRGVLLLPSLPNGPRNAYDPL